MREQVLTRWSNSEALGETWEDKARLKERFPLAEAWGQASAQGEGDVSVPNEAGPQGSSKDLVPTVPRAARPKKPNPRVTGPAWVN